MMVKMLVLTLFLINVVTVIESTNILGFFPIPSISHQVVYQPIWKELSLRGHQVTVLTPNPLKDKKLTNLTEIDLGFAYERIIKADLPKLISKDNYQIQNIVFGENFFTSLVEEEILHPEVQSLINDQSKKFDLVLVECFYPLVYGFAAKFKAPVIGISSLGALLQSHDALGNPTHPVINPDIGLNFEGKMGLYKRTYSTFYNLWYRLLYYWYILPKADKIARKYFGNDIPYIGDVEKNTSMLFVNVNPLLHSRRPNVAAIVELGQMHIKPKKPLPSDLQNYLDNSTEGVIYFSLGSNVKSANLSTDFREKIIGALSELPYNVLWKWETDYLPDQPKNVLTRKWLPQQDVLGHPNIKAFITQGGLQSAEEAIFNSIPMVVMPFFADQPQNAQKMVELEIALSISHNTMTKNDLKSAVLEVATNKKYKIEIGKARALIFDQPMSGLEKAVWWTEYVLRHKGAKHLRSPAVDMPWYQYMLIDVMLVFLVILSGIICLIYFVLQLLVFKKIPKNRYKIKLK